ncbi:major facilitator superfamily nitrite extrusion protein [Salmonella enterica subsp. enterica]|uniref:Major facilitator superfamily nitrite extrusion protein n=1 Tax=Salmonella enterica I TaxID=59201 RepID=A0A379URM5_SALET|nr:major facilitator superfamily nitrite extrusion protein [Salmonella enterica subsp. enterica]
MISVIFRKLTMDRVKAEGGSEERAMREAATDTAAALGFISAIGAIGGFFIPKAFGSSLALTGSPVGAMKVFLFSISPASLLPGRYMDVILKIKSNF